MKLSEAAETQIRDVANSVQWAIDNEGPRQISESLCAFANVCISIGVEIAMQHRHVTEKQVGIHHSGYPITERSETGPAEAIDHD